MRKREREIVRERESTTVRKRKRERERDRQTDRQTDRQIKFFSSVNSISVQKKQGPVQIEREKRESQTWSREFFLD
jgi:hypothetical protein